MSNQIENEDSSVEIKELRNFGNAVLAQRYGKLEPIVGQGIARGTRIKFIEDGKAMRCAIKVATNRMGRISFPYQDGTWGALSEVDRVLYVRVARERPGEFEAQMHTQETLLKAFTQNRHEAEEKEFTNLPAWLSADKENYPRSIGSGFGKHALWKEFSGTPAPVKNPSTTTVHPVAYAIEKAKQSLAKELKELGISASSIEISIRL